jgi:hypothetical protein
MMFALARGAAAALGEEVAAIGPPRSPSDTEKPRKHSGCRHGR